MQAERGGFVPKSQSSDVATPELIARAAYDNRADCQAADDATIRVAARPRATPTSRNDAFGLGRLPSRGVDFDAAASISCIRERPRVFAERGLDLR